MAGKKTNVGGGVSALFREAGAQAKLQPEKNLLVPGAELVVPDPEGRPQEFRIFNILDYIEQPWGLAMKLHPVQRFIVKLFYGLKLDETLPANEMDIIRVTDMFNTKVLHTFTEREYLTFLYNEGRCNISEQDHPRRELLLSIGRRGGKSTLSSIFASYEIYRILNLQNPQHYYGLPNGDRIQIINVATDKDQAGILYNMVTGHLAKCEYFKPYVANNTQSHVLFRTPYEIDKYGPVVKQQNGKFVSFNGKASLRVTFKAATPKGLRGAGNIIVILDEMAHFQEDGATSAKDIYDAVTPSTAAFSRKDPTDPRKKMGDVESRIICISSPLNKAGMFYELYHRAMSNGPGSENMIAIQAPTWEVNPTIPATYYRQKYHADPAVFMTEHGAEFSDRVRGWIEREVDLTDCIDVDRVPAYGGRPREPHQLGLDVGLTKDGTSIAITKAEGDRIVLVYHETWSAGVDWRTSNPHLTTYSTDYARRLADVERLDFEEITNWIISLAKRFYLTDAIFDRWNGIPLEQSLRKAGFNQFRSEFFTKDMSSKMYQNMKMLMFDRKIVLYDYPRTINENNLVKHSPLISELLSLQAEQLSKNLVSVEAPKVEGAHDDLSDALVRAVWLSTERLTNQKVVAGSRLEGSRSSGMSVQRSELAKARRLGGVIDRPSSRMQQRMRLNRR